MINKYGLINHFDKINAYLSIVFDELPKGLLPKQDEDLLIYEKEGKIYRIDIFNLKKYVKIKIKGLITLPNYELIAILNGYLGKYDIMLMSKPNSGFIIVKDNDVYKVKVLKDTLIADGTFVKEDRYATYQDLDLNEPNEIIILDKEEISDKDINKDFFQMEESEL
ncbi:MAG: hypothetical protein J6N95_06760 [Bacilli bacterium]|nr:hypothetical protein [Bacilli bacterium]